MSAQRSAWSFYPWAVVGAFVVVIAVNGGMVWSALATFPGAAVTDDFGHSNRYDEVLARAAQQAALGWRVEAGVQDGRATLALIDHAGQPLAGAQVGAVARRPLGPDQRTKLAFREAAPGRYVADRVLPAVGQWDLLLSVVHDGSTLHATPRIVVR